MHTHSSPVDNVAVVILAAGKGTRMNNGHGLPKVLSPLYGRPLISHLLHSIEACRVSRPPVIVVGHKADMIKKALGDYYVYVEQTEQRGTGHAVSVARSELEGKVDHVLVLYGDHPHLPCQVIDDLLDLHFQYDNSLTLATTTVADFDDWRERLAHYGRIVRDETEYVERIVEYKDATEQQRSIREVNPGYYCFNAKWLWSHLDKLSDNNQAGELYLTDLIAMAIDEKVRIGTHEIDPLAALGVNTQQELLAMEEVIKANGAHPSS